MRFSTAVVALVVGSAVADDKSATNVRARGVKKISRPLDTIFGELDNHMMVRIAL